ncbi:MAG TPA: chemotaxis protein CheD [Rhodocyclaceae bacterium]|nr:chemotaxis protein CheD [Rhodocyclaceae bacterium]HNH35551.1 chemotaxis protein CheD [Rhodocyclaceae bacterium]
MQASAKDLERQAININPGGWAVDKQRPIATLLGSCVAVCLFDPLFKLGGMNHFLLPSRSGSHADTDVVLAGDYAMEVLVNAMLAKGARKDRMVAKAFGGGTIVSNIRMAIGERNAEFAKEWLAREGVVLAASDFLGPWSRKVILDPATGDVWCRRMPVTQAVAAEVTRAESVYEQTLEKPVPVAGKKIELF